MVIINPAGPSFLIRRPPTCRQSSGCQTMKTAVEWRNCRRTKNFCRCGRYKYLSGDGVSVDGFRGFSVTTSGEVRECARFRRRAISSPRTISRMLPENEIHEFRDKLDHSDDRSENAACCINPDGNCDRESQPWRHPESRSK